MFAVVVGESLPGYGKGIGKKEWGIACNCPMAAKRLTVLLAIPAPPIRLPCPVLATKSLTASPGSCIHSAATDG
jgi:hypothetical protein